MLGFPSPQGRTGVDLFPDECRVVDVRVHAQEGVSGDVRVKSFALLTEGRMSATLSAELSRLREDQQFPPHAWVTIWGLRSDDAETARQIQPLVGAGYVVRSVCTPAMALTAVARRHGGRTPGAAAYVALETGAMCLTIVRDGVLLFSREIPWEFAASADVIVERLSDELRRSVLLARQSFRTVVERIVLCGGMPRLRALTSPIGVRVEPAGRNARFVERYRCGKRSRASRHVPRKRCSALAGDRYRSREQRPSQPDSRRRCRARRHRDLRRLVFLYGDIAIRSHIGSHACATTGRAVTDAERSA